MSAEPPDPGTAMDMPTDKPEPLYEVHVFCCVNQRPATHRRGCCASKGALNLANYMCRRSMVTANHRRVRINLAGCMNVCEYGPTMVIYPEGVWYRYDNDADIDEILEQHVIRGRRVERLLIKPDPALQHR